LVVQRSGCCSIRISVRFPRALQEGGRHEMQRCHRVRRLDRDSGFFRWCRLSGPRHGLPRSSACFREHSLPPPGGPPPNLI
jgi:hypothetical protein